VCPNEWGPFPQLDGFLHNAAAGPAAPLVAPEKNGLWPLTSLTVKDVIPPAPGEQIIAQPRESRWRRFIRWVLRRPPPVPAPLIDDEALARLLVECTAWLDELTLERAATLFAPFWEDLPTRAFRVSEKAIAWALAVRRLDRSGPTAFNMARGCPPLGIGDLPGDFLALHLMIERLVEGLFARWRLAAPPAVERRPGGMRRREFLKAYPALAIHLSRQMSDDVMWRQALDAILNALGGMEFLMSGDVMWRQALNALLDHSPLTRLVYMDVIGRPLTGQEVLPLVDLGPREERWREVWVSLLARSLLGVVLSPDPSLEALRLAEAELSRLEAERIAWIEERRRSWWRRLFSHRLPEGGAPPTPLDMKVAAQRNRVQATGQRMNQERLARLRTLAEVLARGSPYLHMLVMDMLTRLAAGQAAEEASARRWAGPPPASVGWQMFDEGGAGADRLVRMLVGRGLDHVGELLASRPAETEAVADILSPNTAAPCADVARRTGVPTETIELLAARFGDELAGRIHLPMPAPAHLAPHPEQCLAQCLAVLRAALPVAQVQAQTEQVFEQLTETVAE
jgi:hypothetical protein